MAFSGGTGQPLDPYLISTVQDFKDMDSLAEYNDKNFKQTNDLDFASEGTLTSAVGFTTISSRIVYDGQNYKIKNLTMNGTTQLGLFKDISAGTIKNIVLDNCNITGTDILGIIAVYAGDCTFDNIVINSNCSINGTSIIGGIVGNYLGNTNILQSIKNCTTSITIIGTSDDIGGLVGTVGNNTQIYNCTSTASCSITGNNRIGGLAGNGIYMDTCTNSGAVIGNDYIGGISGSTSTAINCVNNGTITGSNNYIGGISGYSEYVKRCSNTSNISGNYWVGGIAGIGYADMDVGAEADRSYIEFSKNSGTISGAKYVGGIAGMRGFILCCANTGNVSASNNNAGGIVGFGDSIRHCYNANPVSAANYAGGICGYQVSYGGTSYDGKNMVSELNLSIGNITAITNGGGLCGFSTNMTNSVALMSNIIRSSGTATTFGRLYGSMATAFTTNGQALSISTFNGSGETPNHDESATGKDGIDITASNAKLVASYEPADKMPIYFYNVTTNPDGFWTIVAGTSYPYHMSTYSATLEENTDFPNASETTTGKDGSDSGGTTASEYTGIGWNRFYWSLTDGSFPSHYLTEETTYFNDSNLSTGDNGTDITLANAKKKTTYETLGWDFATIWAIAENTTYPYLTFNPPNLSFFKVWTGSQWNTAPLKRYTGTEWVAVSTKIYSGTEWL